MTTPPFAATAVALWTVVALALIVAVYSGAVAGARSGAWFRRRRWRLVPGTGRGMHGPPCPGCGAGAVRIVHGHPTAGNILRACVGHMVLVTSVPCPPPWACTACGRRFAEPESVTWLPAGVRPARRSHHPDRCGGGLAPVVPLFGGQAGDRHGGRRRQPG